MRIFLLRYSPICLLLLFISVFSSCSNHSQNKTSVNVDKEASAKLRADSIARRNAVLDSLAQFAWGYIPFGISLKEAKKFEQFKNASEYGGYELVMNHEEVYQIERIFGLKSFVHIMAQFNEDELTYIHIKSLPVTATKFDLLLKDCSTYTCLFSEKYNVEPYILHDIDTMSPSDLDPGDRLSLVGISIGEKYIMMDLCETIDGYEYFYEVSISNNSFPKKKRQQTEEEKRKEKEYDENLKRVKNNSF